MSAMSCSSMIHSDESRISKPIIKNTEKASEPGLPLRFLIFPNSEEGKIYFNEFPKLGIKISMDFLFFLKIGRALFNQILIFKRTLVYK